MTGLKMNRTATAAALGLLTLAGVGCKNQMYSDNREMRKENLALREQVDQMRKQTSTPPMAMAEPAAPEPTPAPAAPDPAPPEQPMQMQPIVFSPPAPPPRIEGVESEFNSTSGEQTLRVAGDVLFDSGSATLKPTARKTLSKVADALKSEYAGKPVRVEGHTDSDPIRKSKDKFPTNDALSLARANAVEQYLQQQGVESSRLEAKGLGATQPRGGAKSGDRRVEIIVVTR